MSPRKSRLSLGDRIFGVGIITQDKIIRNRQQKVYGRIFGNKR